MRKNEEERPASSKPKDIRELRERLGLSNEPYVYTPPTEIPIDTLKDAYPDRDLTDEEVLIATRREFRITRSLRALADSGAADINKLLTVAEETAYSSSYGVLSGWANICHACATPIGMRPRLTMTNTVAMTADMSGISFPLYFLRKRHSD